MRQTRFGRALAVAGVGGALAIGAAACGSGSGGDGKATSIGANGETAAKIAFLTGDVSDFGQAQIDGLESVAKRSGGDVKVFDGGVDAQAQNADCQDAITSGNYNGIVMNGNSGPAAVACVTAAKSAGIPVVALETAIGQDPDEREPQVDGVVGSVVLPAADGAEGQVQQLRLACEQLRANPCDYIHIIGDRAYQLDDTRLKVFEQEIGDDPRYRRVGLGEDHYDGARGLTVAGDLLRAQPATDVVVASTDSTAVQAARVVRDLGRGGRVLITGDGGSRQGVAAIERGDVFNSQALAPFTMGELAAEMIVDAVNDREIGEPAPDMYRLVQPRFLDRGNVGGFRPQWG